MKKKDYRPEIHAVFELIRSKTTVESRSQVIRLQILERMERNALDENSKNALKEAKAFLRARKQRTYNLPLAGKKFIVLSSGKVKEGPLYKAKKNFSSSFSN